MKSKILIALCLTIVIITGFVSSLQAQETFITEDSQFELQCQTWNFTDVIYVDSTLTKDQLFMLARQWFSESFVSSKSVLDNIDKDAGVLYGKGVIDVPGSDNGIVSFNIEVRCKDGRVKYNINNFMHSGALRLTLFGMRPTAGPVIYDDFGSLTQNERSLGYGVTGRRKDQWDEWRNYCKQRTYYLIQNLKNGMDAKVLNAKDDW